jgi:predicted exporter
MRVRPDAGAASRRTTLLHRAAAIVLLLALQLRSAQRVVAVFLPLVAAVVLVASGLHLAGVRLNLLHLVGLLLIVAVGSNYALFFDTQDEAGGGNSPQTLASLLFANLTTVAGFGLLGLSDVPVLQAIGITVGPGAIAALLFSAILSRQSEHG